MGKLWRELFGKIFKLYLPEYIHIDIFPKIHVNIANLKVDAGGKYENKKSNEILQEKQNLVWKFPFLANYLLNTFDIAAWILINNGW